MTEEEFYNKILDADACNFRGTIYEFLGMTEEEYRNKIHCKCCKKSKKERYNCRPHNAYCCEVCII